MSKLPLVLRELHRSETRLVRDLLAVADRHRVDAEIFHVARDVARWSQIHIRRLAEIAPDYGLRLDPAPRWSLPQPVRRVVRAVVTRLRRRPEPGLVLLADLRRIHRAAAGVSLDWEVLAQSAQGMKERRLFELARTCHPESLRQMRWANAQLKESSPQVIAS